MVDDTKLSISKLQLNAKNACGTGMWQLGLNLVGLLLLFLRKKQLISGEKEMDFRLRKISLLLNLNQGSQTHGPRAQCAYVALTFLIKGGKLYYFLKSFLIQDGGPFKDLSVKPLT